MEKRRTKGQVEAEVSKALNRFEKEYMGRGPVEVQTVIIEDAIFVRLKGVLTKAEKQLVTAESGIELVKKMRANLLESAAATLYQIICDITGLQVVSLHTDISTRSGERIITFILSQNLEKALRAG